MHALASVGDAAIRLQRDARRGGFGDDGDQLLSLHKGGLLLEIDFLHAHLPASVGVELSVVALSVDRLAVHVAHEAALAARELRHVIGPAKLVDDLVQRVVGHLQLVELAEELLLEALELLDLRWVWVVVGGKIFLLLNLLLLVVVGAGSRLAPLRRRLLRQAALRSGGHLWNARLASRPLFLLVIRASPLRGRVRIIRIDPAVPLLGFAPLGCRCLLWRSILRHGLLEGILFIRRLDSAACALALRVGAWSTALVVNVPAEVFEAQCRLDSIVLVLDRVAVGARVVVYHLADALRASFLDLEPLPDQAVVGLRFGHLLILEVDDVLLLLFILGIGIEARVLNVAAPETLRPPLRSRSGGRRR
mmetsp:Transcript_10393/g.34400  ORF Transcript_10393/g.34400 Transcript_10393/m.34400 type:complete len:363 (+) Transcript_10393:2527-3615(+)